MRSAPDLWPFKERDVRLAIEPGAITGRRLYAVTIAGGGFHTNAYL